MSEGFCESCEYWKPRKDKYGEQVGICDLPNMFGHDIAADQPMWAGDEESGFAQLLTRPGFGCHEWEPAAKWEV